MAGGSQCVAKAWVGEAGSERGIRFVVKGKEREREGEREERFNLSWFSVWHDAQKS